MIKIICITCEKKFFPKSERNRFCSRRCFKKDFYKRKKALELTKKKFPTFNCPSCWKQIDLDFDPIKEEKKWTKFYCPFCSVLMINVCEEIKMQDIFNP